jgi:hypothetical protein
MITQQLVGVILVLFLLVGMGLARILRNDKIARMGGRSPGTANRGDLQDPLEIRRVMYEDFLREQLDRERELRRQEMNGHDSIVSMTARPFRGRPLPPVNASIDEIVRITGIRSYEEVNFDLFERRPHQAIMR